MERREAMAGIEEAARTVMLDTFVDSLGEFNEEILISKDLHLKGLSLIDFASAIEDHFGIDLSDTELLQLEEETSTIKNLVDLVLEKSKVT